jgi:hypothetical protein
MRKVNLLEFKVTYIKADNWQNLYLNSDHLAFNAMLFYLYSVVSLLRLFGYNDFRVLHYLLQYWDLNSGSSPWATTPAFFFIDGCFQDRVSWTVCPGWLRTLIFLISASWVARIIGAWLIIALLCCFSHSVLNIMSINMFIQWWMKNVRVYFTINRFCVQGIVLDIHSW